VDTSSTQSRISSPVEACVVPHRACECDRDHGNHDVDGREFEGSSSAGLGRAFDMTLAQVDDWMSRGIVADAWREWAGLPMRVPPA
jgi:hypothetical protein